MIIDGEAAGLAVVVTLRRKRFRRVTSVVFDDTPSPYDRKLLLKDHPDGKLGDGRLQTARKRPRSGNSIVTTCVYYDWRKLRTNAAWISIEDKILLTRAARFKIILTSRAYKMLPNQNVCLERRRTGGSEHFSGRNIEV